MKFIRKYIPIIYIVLGTIAFFYVRDIVNDETLDVDKSIKDKKVVMDIKPVNVTLSVRGFNQNTNYSLRKENDETFDDFLENLVDYQGFRYEKTEYTYGTVYDNINGEIAPEGYIWKIYANDEDFTLNTSGLKLTDGTIYSLVLEKK
ncbi:hypothetical protein ACFLZK_00840 [Patescibacteria group bacterium]